MTESEIETLVDRFESGVLPRSEWTHSRHLIVALWYLSRYGRIEGLEHIRQGIQRYNQITGNLQGYHETLTQAWVTVVARYLPAEGPGNSLASIAERLIEECGDPSLLLRYYSRARLFSDAARRAWVAPDLQNLD